MAVNKDYIRALLREMKFRPINGSIEIWSKTYKQHDNYVISVDFSKSKDNIEYKNTSVIKGIIVANKGTTNFSKDENFVVLECVDRLLEKGYKPECIELEHTWPSGRNNSGRLDIMVKKDDKPYLMIECKTWDKEFKKEKENMKRTKKVGGQEQPKGQLFSYCFEEKTTEYLCLYASVLDGNTILYENAIIPVEEEWKTLSNQKEVFDYWNKSFKKNGIFDKDITPYNIECKALMRTDLDKITHDASKTIFYQFLEILRHNAISDKPNAFNKILNLFICKIIDEDRNETEELQFQWKDDSTYISLQSNLEDLYKQGMERFLDIEVTDYSDADIERSLSCIEDDSKTKIRQMFQELRLQKNPEFAFKEVYNKESFEENAKVLREVVELLQPYQFRYGHKQQFLGEFFELLLNTSIKQESGQYFTPVPVARFMISALPLQEMIEKKIANNERDILPTTIDYACGSGHFLTEYMDILQTIINEYDTTDLKRSYKNVIEKWKQPDDEESLYGEFEWAKDYVYGIEKDYRLVKTTKISTFLNGDGEANIIHADGLDKFSSAKYKGELESSTTSNNKFDLVIANPPYSVNSFKQTLPSDDNDFITYKYLTDTSKEIECLFVERTNQLLKEGGYAAIILPFSMLGNPGALSETTRDIILRNFYIEAIAHMGASTFMATGTNTVIMFLKKRSEVDYLVIKKLVDKYIQNLADFSYDGSLKVMSKYVETCFDNISYEDYLSYINNKPNQNILELEYYQDILNKFYDSKEYKDKIKTKAYKELTVAKQQEEIKQLFGKEIKEFESTKIIDYLLTLNCKTLLLSKQTKVQEERDFLGYEFSGSRTDEGIHYHRDDEGHIMSALYDETDLNGNPEKVNYYINKAIKGEEFDIPESLIENLSYVDTTSLINWRNYNFTNVINIKPIEYILPSQYNQTKLEKLVTMPIVRGKSTSYGNSSVRIIKSGQVRGGYEFDFSDKYYVTDTFQSDERNLVKGDILINSTGVGTAGRVNIFTLDGDFVVDSHVTIVRVDKTKVLPEYVLFALSSIGYKNLESLAMGQSGQIELSIPIISNIKIPVPPMPIQEQIVKAYEEFEKTIADNNLKIKINKDAVRKIADDAFVEYPNKELRTMCLPPVYGANEKATRGNRDEDYRYIRITDIDNDGNLLNDWKTAAHVQEQYILKNGDFLFARSGATAGKVFCYDSDKHGKALYAGYLIKFTCKEDVLDPKFLFMLCQSNIYTNWINSTRGGTAQPNINAQQFGSFKFGVPDDTSIQKKIVESAEKLWSENEKLKRANAEIKEKEKTLLSLIG